MSGPAHDEAAEYIQKLLDEAPTLDDAQRTRLAELLRPVHIRPVVQMADVRNVEQEAPALTAAPSTP